MVCLSESELTFLRCWFHGAAGTVPLTGGISQTGGDVVVGSGGGDVGDFS